MSPYLPTAENLAAVAVTWAVGAGMALTGTAATGRRAPPEFRIVAGWGAVCLVLTAWGVFVPASLRIAAVGIAAATLAAQLLPSRRTAAADWRSLARLLLLSLPIWLIMAPIRPSQVDTFLNLLPNAWYLVDYARLPTAVLPPSFSFLPAAPYNTQFLAFLGSLAIPDYPAAGMALANVMLTLLAGLAIARVLALPGRDPSWGGVALGLLLATLLNPGFVPRVNFSAYGETALAVTALLAGCLFVAAQSAQAEGRAPGHGLTLALILAAMINTKQSGVGLVAALAAAALVIALAEPAARRPRLAAHVGIALVPAAALYAVWRWHAAHAGVAELEPLPFDRWHWDTLPETLVSIGEAVAEKPVYFVAVAGAMLGWPLMLRRQGWTPATRLLGFHAAAFVFYNGFLLLTYIAHFSAEMSAEAHSFFRYNTHLSLILVLALALLARELSAALWIQPRCRRVGAVAVVVAALLVPLGFFQRLRFDLAMPQPLVWDLAAELKPYLEDHDRLALLMPGDRGDVGLLLEQYLAEVPPRRRALTIASRADADLATLAEVAESGYRRALISCTADGLLGLPPGVAALLKYDGEGWRPVASFAYAAGPAVGRYQRSRSWPALCR